MVLRLAAQTALVRGRYAALLMDIYRGRMQRISLEVADLIDSLALGDGTNLPQLGVPEAAIIERLVERGFISKFRACFASSYAVDAKYPECPIVRTISFNSSAPFIEAAAQLAIECHRELGLYNVLILVPDQVSSQLSCVIKTLLACSPYLIVDLVMRQVEINRFPGELTADSRRIRLTPLPPGEGDENEFGIPTVGKDSIYCRSDLYQVLRIYNESFGCIHIDNEGHVFPDLLEKSFAAGDFRSLTIDSLRNGIDELQHYWSVNKDQRKKCSGCEFRYACPNTLAARSVESDLRSEPANCNYQVETGIWL